MDPSCPKGRFIYICFLDLCGNFFNFMFISIFVWNLLLELSGLHFLVHFFVFYFVIIIERNMRAVELCISPSPSPYGQNILIKKKKEKKEKKRAIEFVSCFNGRP